jgi:hypothetical protein
MSIAGINERDGPWYVLEHRVMDTQGNTVVELGRSDWADWSQSGELLFARAGRIYRIVTTDKSILVVSQELIDLRDLKFEAVVAPPEATLWNGRAPRGRILAKSAHEERAPRRSDEGVPPPHRA